MKSIDEIVRSQLKGRSFVLTRANLGVESDDAFHRLVEALIVAPEDGRFRIAGFHKNASGLYAIVYCEPRAADHWPRGRGRVTASNSQVPPDSRELHLEAANGAKDVPSAYVERATGAGDLT